MEAAMSCPNDLPSMLFCLCYLLLFIRVPFATSLSFSFNFSDPGSYSASSVEIAFAGDAFFRSPGVELTMNDINERNDRSIGRAWYARPVPLWDSATGEVASFSTAFSFQIKPSNAAVSADGMAFFLGYYPSGVSADSAGGYLGLFNSSINKEATGRDRFVAVEFDTHKNEEWELDGNHVGIDINTVVSVASTSPDKNLTCGTTMTAEINYDSGTEMLFVTLWINETSYHVNTSIDMTRCLPEEVAVGFSAATGTQVEVHRVLSWSFNSTLAQPGTGASKSQAKLKAGIASVVAILSVLVCAYMGFLLRRRRRTWKEATEMFDFESHDENDKARFGKGVGPRRYHYSELATATANFAEDKKLGRGGFGHVYQGLLRIDDLCRRVAIKKFSPDSSAQGRKEFEAEINIISRLRHRNLVQLIGWSDSSKGLLIVYELVSGGSLDKHIYNNARLLTWPERYQIIIGLGSALRYLHAEWEQSIVHGDIEHGAMSRTTKVVLGTAGYIDPELVNTRRPSTESDVYSFGIVLLEMVTGRRPVEESDDKFFVLLRWVWDLHMKNAITEAVDKKLKGGDEVDERQMERVLMVGLWCAQPDRRDRPSMVQAMHVLQSKDAKLPALRTRMYKAEPVLIMGEYDFSDLSIGTSAGTTTGYTATSEPIVE